MASGQTQYYGLSQWEAADKVERVDFNSDNAKIDGALRALAEQAGQKADRSAVDSLSNAGGQKADKTAPSAAEGGIPARHRRYAENNRLLIEKMRAMGFAPYIDGSRQGPIITTFFYPAGVPFQFSEFYTYIKERGYVLYPGKLTDADTFRVGNIGEIYPEDREKPTAIIADFLAARKEEIA